MKARWTWRSLSCHTVGLLSTSIYSVSGTDLNGSMGLGGLEGRFISLIIQGLCFVTKAQVHWNREITCSSEFSLKAVRESVQYFRSCSFRGWGLNYAAELPRGGVKVTSVPPSLDSSISTVKMKYRRINTSLLFVLVFSFKIAYFGRGDLFYLLLWESRWWKKSHAQEIKKTSFIMKLNFPWLNTIQNRGSVMSGFVDVCQGWSWRQLRGAQHELREDVA